MRMRSVIIVGLILLLAVVDFDGVDLDEQGGVFLVAGDRVHPAAQFGDAGLDAVGFGFETGSLGGGELDLVAQLVALLRELLELGGLSLEPGPRGVEPAAQAAHLLVQQVELVELVLQGHGGLRESGRA